MMSSINQSDKSCSIAAIIDFVSREKDTSYIRILDLRILYLLILKYRINNNNKSVNIKLCSIYVNILL
jgi:hypothetical protein